MNSLTEAKQNRMFAIFQRTNYRPSAVSLIHLLWLGILDYARWRNTDLSHIHRVYLSRANILMPLLRLMLNRATGLFKWAMMKFIAKLNSTASVDSQGDGVWVSLCALRVGAAFDRSRYNKSKDVSLFSFSLSERHAVSQKGEVV